MAQALRPPSWDWLEQPIRDVFGQLAVEYLGQQPSA